MKLRSALLHPLAPNQVLAQVPQQLTPEGANKSNGNADNLVLGGNIGSVGQRGGAGYWRDTRRKSLICNRQGSERRQRSQAFWEEAAMAWRGVGEVALVVCSFLVVVVVALAGREVAVARTEWSREE